MHLEAYFQDRISIAKKLDLVLGIQGLYNHQEFKLPFDKYNEYEDYSSSSHKTDSSGLNPRAGLIWQAHEQVQVYGNVSCSFQPKTLDLASITRNNNRVKDETATTVEIGTRGGTSLFSWEANIYHSWVKNELLAVESPPKSRKYIKSSADALHTGVEFGMEANIPMDLLNSGDNLRIRGSYTWSDFRFDEEITFGNNKLPGIPEHVGLTEVMYQHRSGFSFGPNLEVNSPNT